MSKQHIGLLVAGALGAAATYVAQTQPDMASWAHGVVALCGALTLVLGGTSASMLAKPPAAP